MSRASARRLVPCLRAVGRVPLAKSVGPAAGCARGLALPPAAAAAAAAGRSNIRGGPVCAAAFSSIPSYVEYPEDSPNPPQQYRRQTITSVPAMMDQPIAPMSQEAKRMPVVAWFVGQRINLQALMEEYYPNVQGFRPTDSSLVVPLTRDPDDEECIRSAIFFCRHGSVVFFNVEDGEQGAALHRMIEHCGEPVDAGDRFQENLECRLRPWQERYHEMGADIIHLRELDENTIKVIGDVIGHSVAINFYNKKADRMLQEFMVLNNSVEGSGEFTGKSKKDLFKLVAQSNKILTDAMSSGLLEQVKVAWNHKPLDDLWTDLRQEFNIHDRYSKVEHKINHVHSNTKYFLEILNISHSNKLEQTIVWMIGAEIVLGLTELLVGGENIRASLWAWWGA